MGKIRGKVAIVGIGEVPTGRFPELDCLDYVVESVNQCLKDAGMSKDDIDCVFPSVSVYSALFNADLILARLVEEMGFKNVKLNYSVTSGGSSSGNQLRTAAGLINAGEVKNVLCFQADKLASGLSSQAGIDMFAYGGISREWEMPMGLHYSAIAGLSMERYMHETGTTEEQIAAVQVSNRKWAELNPHAMFRKPLTIEEVIASKMLSTPLRAKMSNMLADGGHAFIVTSAQEAKERGQKAVYYLGGGARVTHFSFSQEKDITRFGFAQAAKDAFHEAGLTPKDIDVAEIYDSYPIYELITLEELGFVKRGEGGKFFLDGHTCPGGKLPVTTNGGMSSQGHTGSGGGFAITVEGVRQLMGKAGERQVKGARFAVVTGTGGAYFDSHVEILGTEIP